MTHLLLRGRDKVVLAELSVRDDINVLWSQTIAFEKKDGLLELADDELGCDGCDEGSRE